MRRKPWMYSPDDTVCTLTEFLCDCISLVDDEVLVEDLEYFAPLEVGHPEIVLLGLQKSRSLVLILLLPARQNLSLIHEEPCGDGKKAVGYVGDKRCVGYEVEIPDQQDIEGRLQRVSSKYKEP